VEKALASPRASVTIIRMPPSTSSPFQASATTDPQVTEWALRRGRFRRLFHDVYVSRDTTITPRLLARGALLLAEPGSYISHHTAARIWGGVVPDTSRTDVTSPRRRLRTGGILGHRVKERATVTSFGGIPLTSPEQTFVDLALYLDLVDLVVLGDSLVKGRRCTVESLLRLAEKHRGPGCRRAKRAARLVRAGVDSPMESRLRMLMVLAGLPEPVVDHRIRWPDGRVRWRLDLSFPDFRLIIEYDGRQHADSDVQWGGDLGRREWLDSNDWRIVVNVSRDIYRTPAQTLARITTAMRQRGMTVPPLRDEWRRHFPSLPEDLAHPA
jgi:hypothetical protein